MQDDIGFYSKRQVMEITTFSDTTLWRRVRAEAFPKPVQLSPGRVAWPRKAVHEWLEELGAIENGGRADAL